MKMWINKNLCLINMIVVVFNRLVNVKHLTIKFS